nr:FecR family protein [Pedobacter sp. ASV19]
MKTEQAEILLAKYNDGTATPAERLLLDHWFITESAARQQKDAEELDYFEIQHRVWKQISEQTNTNEAELPAEIKFPDRVKLWPRIAVAAAVLLVIGAGLFFYTSYFAPRHPERSAATRDLLPNDIKPGSNKAYLTLANGKRISLTDAAKGAIAQQSGVQITKTIDGQVIYTAPGDPGLRRDDRVALNTIETPKGGQYQIRLPDGSKVWLNAASKLIYPVSFNGRGQREVTLSGEAYFEISKDKQHPFRVKSAGQEVEVLGTHFNINSYSDEVGVKTTLLEGSVSISALRHLDPARHLDGVVLKPGEQATLQASKINVQQVNPDYAVAWKNGLFSFNKASIQEVMKQLSRWYDVDVEFEGKPITSEFTGKIYRNVTLQQALKLLGYTDVKFKIEGKKIIISP